MKETERDSSPVVGRGLGGRREKIVRTPVVTMEEYREAYAQLQCTDGKVVGTFTRESKPRDEPEKIPFQDAIEKIEANPRACAVR